MQPIMITLDQINAHDPCKDGWRKILKATHLHGGYRTKPFRLADALDHNGFDDALWALRCLPEHGRLWRMYAVWCARQVRHLMTDQRSIAALDVAWRHAHGEATDDELDAAGAAARTAAMAAAMAAAKDAAGGAAAAAARSAAWAAAAAARERQAAKLRAILLAGEWVDD
jgi:hypothetical protein